MRFLLALTLISPVVTVALYLCCWFQCERRTAAWNARGRRLFGEDAAWAFYPCSGLKWPECAYKNNQFYAWLDHDGQPQPKGDLNMTTIEFFADDDYEGALKYLGESTSYKYNECRERLEIDIYEIEESSAAMIAESYEGNVLGVFAYRDGDGELVKHS